MELADEMRELREYGGQSAIDRKNVQLDADIDKIAAGYRAVDTAKRLNRKDR